MSQNHFFELVSEARVRYVPVGTIHTGKEEKIVLGAGSSLIFLFLFIVQKTKCAVFGASYFNLTTGTADHDIINTVHHTRRSLRIVVSL
jgi:hypothetical protein